MDVLVHPVYFPTFYFVTLRTILEMCFIEAYNVLFNLSSES